VAYAGDELLIPDEDRVEAEEAITYSNWHNICQCFSSFPTCSPAVPEVNLEVSEKMLRDTYVKHLARLKSNDR
jgi:hypothetical protein